MNYWLLCLPREDLEHCMRKGTFGLSRKCRIGHVRIGDRVVCCAGKGDWKIIGLSGLVNAVLSVILIVILLKND